MMSNEKLELVDMKPRGRLGPLGLLAAILSLPVLWTVVVGMVVALHVRPKKRLIGRRLVAEWGGWLMVPLSAGYWAWAKLTRRPYAVLAVAGLVTCVALSMGGLKWLPLAWTVAMITAAVLPAIDDLVTALAGARGGQPPS